MTGAYRGAPERGEKRPRTRRERQRGRIRAHTDLRADAENRTGREVGVRSGTWLLDEPQRFVGDVGRALGDFIVDRDTPWETDEAARAAYRERARERGETTAEVGRNVRGALRRVVDPTDDQRNEWRGVLENAFPSQARQAALRQPQRRNARERLEEFRRHPDREYLLTADPSDDVVPYARGGLAEDGRRLTDAIASDPAGSIGGFIDDTVGFGGERYAREGRAEVYYRDALGRRLASTGASEEAIAANEAAERQARGYDALNTAFAGAELTGAGLLRSAVPAVRGTLRTASRPFARETPEMLRVPARIAEQQEARAARRAETPLTNQGRAFAGRVALGAGAGAVIASDSNNEGIDEVVAPLVGAGVASVAPRIARGATEALNRLPKQARIPAAVGAAGAGGAGVALATNAAAQEDTQEYEYFDDQGNPIPAPASASNAPSPSDAQEYEYFDDNGNPIPPPANREDAPFSLNSMARTVAGAAPLALLPGSARARVGRVGATALGAESAAALADGTSYEDAARVAGAAGGALTTEALLALRARGAAANAPRAIAPEVLAGEQEFGALTAGERARDPRAMQRESALRRGGPEQAQDTLRGFDDQRAPQVADNLMRRLATRGLDPVSPDAGSAGTMLADELRSQLDNMEVEQAARYDRATDLARNVPVAPTDELLANVNRVVDEDFLDVGPAVRVIERLHEQIASGQATYLTVERARQALNRQLGAAMRSGDDAAVYSVRRVIDELDQFVLPRLPEEAAQAIREARGFTQEMMQWYGQQSRPGLSTGHVGRRDPGGAAVRRIIDTDMTGEQVIDAVFGASARPPQSALGAVRRIRDRATLQIQSGGYDAATGAAGRQTRVPGRPSLRGGRSTAGGRRFDPTPAQQARHGVELPKDDLQALREAFVYRLRRPLDARRQGDAMDAGVMARNLRQALHGPGREITETIFNETERATMGRALAHLERMTPPSGQYMPSAPGIAQDVAERSFAALVGNLIGRIPGGRDIGVGIENWVVNGRAIRDARAAVAPYRHGPPPRPPTQPRPRLAGAIAAGTAAGGVLGDENATGLDEYIAPVAGAATALAAPRVMRGIAQRPGAIRISPNAALGPLIGAGLGAGAGYAAERMFSQDAEANAGGAAGRGAGLLGAIVGAAIGARKGRLRGVPADRIARRAEAAVIPIEQNVEHQGNIRGPQQGRIANQEPPLPKRNRSSNRGVDRDPATGRYDRADLVNEAIARDELGNLKTPEAISMELNGDDARASLNKSIALTIWRLQREARNAVAHSDEVVADLARKWNVTPDRVHALADIPHNAVRGHHHLTHARLLVANGVTEPAEIIAALREAAERSRTDIPSDDVLATIASKVRREAGLARAQTTPARREQIRQMMEEIYAAYGERPVFSGNGRGGNSRGGVKGSLRDFARRAGINPYSAGSAFRRHWHKFIAEKKNTAGAAIIGAAGLGALAADDAEASDGGARDWLSPAAATLAGAGAAYGLYRGARFLGERAPSAVRASSARPVTAANSRSASGELRDLRANFDAGRSPTAPLPRNRGDLDAIAPVPPRSQPGGALHTAVHADDYQGMLRVLASAPEVRGVKLERLAHSVNVRPVFRSNGKLDRQATMAAIVSAASSGGSRMTPRQAAITARLREMGLWALPAALGGGALAAHDNAAGNIR